MSFFGYLCCALIIAPSAWAASSSDAVNERIPVSKLELEAHWEVDCEKAWNGFIALANAFKNQSECVIPPQLSHQMHLCAFIYQPPGETALPTCRDFTGARRAAVQGSCRAVALLRDTSAKCEPSEPLR